MKNTLKMFAVLYLGILFPVLANATSEITHRIVSNGAMYGSTQTTSGVYSFDGTGLVISEGSNLTFNFVANAGYHVVDVLIDGSSQGPITTYTFSNIIADHEVTPSFAINVVPIITDPSTETNQDGQGGITSDPSIDTNQDDPIVSDAPIVTESRSSRSSSGSRANNSSVILAISSSTNKIIASTAASCNYLSSYLKIDGDNDSNEVTKLQAFLKNIENINVDINGKFDDKTFEGVKVFQAKYIEETMAPWGSRTPSGQVFFTTKKKINEVYCKSSFALTAEQLAQINSYKNNLAQGIIGINPVTSTGTSTINSEIGSLDNSSQVAAVGASVGGKLWNFVKWLFGK